MLGGDLSPKLDAVDLYTLTSGKTIGDSDIF